MLTCGTSNAYFCKTPKLCLIAWPGAATSSSPKNWSCDRSWSNSWPWEASARLEITVLFVSGRLRTSLLRCCSGEGSLPGCEPPGRAVPALSSPRSGDPRLGPGVGCGGERRDGHQKVPVWPRRGTRSLRLPGRRAHPRRFAPACCSREPGARREEKMWRIASGWEPCSTRGVARDKSWGFL